MADVSIQVNGQTVITPGVYPFDQIVATLPFGFVPTGPLIFVAYGYGGTPAVVIDGSNNHIARPGYVPTNYSDSVSLSNAMRGAPSTSYIDFMYNGTSEVNNASIVTYIEAGPNTQSAASLLASGAVAVVNMVSTNFGTPSNLLKYSVEPGSMSANLGGLGIALSIVDGFSGGSAFGDNLGVPFEVAYTGAASGVVYTVSTTISGQATLLQLISPVAGESVQFDLTSNVFSTVSSLIQEINGTGHFAAIGISSTSTGFLPSSNLDVIANVALPAPVATVNQYVPITATLGDIVYFINTQAAFLATATIANGITSATGYMPVPLNLGYFSGAVNNVPGPADYAIALNAALAVPAWAVFIDSGDPAVRALGAQHAETASSIPQRRWRRFFTGSALAESASTAQTNARNINQINCTYLWPGITKISTTTGLNQAFDGLHVSAACAGMVCGNPVAMPLTAKTLLGTGVEQTTDLSTKIALQGNGVLVLDYPGDTRIPTLMSDVTTWQNDPSAANIFNQQVACRYALAYYLLKNLQPYVGTIESSFDIGRATNAVKVLLNSLVYTGTNSNGILSSWDPNSLVLTYTGANQTLTVQVTVVLVGQVRFIPVDVSIAPLNITTSVSSAAGGVTTV